MNDQSKKLFEWKGYVVGIASVIFTYILFMSYTAEPFYCFIAAIITAGIVWGSYLVIRIMMITMKS